MITQEEIEQIKTTAAEFFAKMTIIGVVFELSASSEKESSTESQEGILHDLLHMDITMPEPKFIIGQDGNTLFDLQRILKIIFTKKLKKAFHFDVDVNGYKKQKDQYLKNLAIESANQVALSGKKKSLAPMSSYERRLIHQELSGRSDVITESQGDGLDRCIVISPR
jgi:predicted RNA-binding protein Jag